MATVVDVAAYILKRCGAMTTMKLQKLAFYSQAESLARRGHPLFDEDFQAWRGGPVCRELYAQHRGKFLIREGELPVNDCGKTLSEEEKHAVQNHKWMILISIMIALVLTVFAASQLSQVLPAFGQL